MARKTTKILTFSDALMAHADNVLRDNQKVAIAKKKYLIKNRDDILLAREEGYPYPVIADVATMELLKTDVPKSIMVKNKEGEEITRETKFSPGEIKNLCEPEPEA